MSSTFDFDNPNMAFLGQLPQGLLLKAIHAVFIDEPIWERASALDLVAWLEHHGYAVTNVYVYAGGAEGPCMPRDVYDVEFDARTPAVHWSVVISDTTGEAERFVRTFEFHDGALRKANPLFSFWAFDETAFRRFQAAEKP